MALENELKVKETSVISLQNRYIYKVRNILIESNPSRHLSVNTGGNYVDDWFQLNKNARKLQSILKGNVPVPGTNIQRLLTESPDNHKLWEYDICGVTCYLQWRINPPRAGGKEYFWAGYNMSAVFGGSYLACPVKQILVSSLEFPRNSG